MVLVTAPKQFEISSVEVGVEIDGTLLETTIVSSQGSGTFPGVVLVHGAGPGERDDYMELAEAFAQAGYYRRCV